MTVQAAFNKVKYTSDGVTLSYEFNFITYEESWISVLDPDVTALGFEVILNADQDNNPGGFVNFTVEPPPIGQDFVILRTAPLEQLLDYTSYDDFPAESHERGLDQGIIIDQQQQEELNRAYKAPIGSDPGEDFGFPPYDAGKLLGWSETEPNQIDNAFYTFQDIINEADRSRDEADRSRDEANRAGTEASNAGFSALLSQDWAEGDSPRPSSKRWADEEEDVPVEGNLFSAKHWAIKSLKARSGLNLIAIISGDNTCPKPGDDPGDCNAPDHRNPGERFSGRPHITGDYYLISAPGDMNLNDTQNPFDPQFPQPVEVGDYIIYLEEIAGILSTGWYKQSGLGGADSSADLISFDDSTTTTKGVTVQAWNEAADDRLNGIDARVDSNIAQLAILFNQFVGSVQTFAVEPSGLDIMFLLCDGQEALRSEYPELFAKIGNFYGAGDGSTTFNLPDYRGKFHRATDRGKGLDPGGRTPRPDGITGDNVGTEQAQAFLSHQHGAAGAHQHTTAGNHAHTASQPAHSHTVSGFIMSGRGSTGSEGQPEVATTLTTSSVAPAITVDAAGDHVHPAVEDHQHAAAGGAETRPVNINVDYYMFTGRYQ